MTQQTAFRDGLFDPDRATPDGLEGADHSPAGKRYDVYRNNVTYSLIAALKTAFPLVRKILGSQSFDTLAPIYVRAHPPSSPLMMHYGADFPRFIEDFAPLKKLGYLADCARLDVALRRSYHAADAPKFDLERFQKLPPDEMMQQKLRLAPSVIVVKSAWPLFDLWRFNMVEGAPKPNMQPQDVLITRPEFDPEPSLLPVGAAAWLEHLAEGKSLGDAYEATAATAPDFDLVSSLTIAFSRAVLRGHEKD